MSVKITKSSNKKSKKLKINHTNKTQLWNIFDNNVENDKKIDPLECIYRNSGDRENCDTCKSSLAFSDEGFLTCTNTACGIIYKDMVDQGAEWRYYGADDNNNSDPTRCGMPINPLLQESSYACKVLSSGKMNYEMMKIRRYNEWYSMPHKEKSQYNEFQRITSMAHNAGIPKMIIDDAIYYHKKTSEYKITFRGDNREGIIAASIYISCRVNNYPRTAKEIAQIFLLDVGSATKGCKNAQAIINDIEKNNVNNEKTDLGETTPKSFIQRFCSKLNINHELTKVCLFISIKIENDNIMPENTPHSIAAGIIYFVSHFCNLNVSKGNIKSVSEISEVTINKCFKKLEKNKDILLPDVIINKYA
jgi:transcription initiation factor TFIIB